MNFEYLVIGWICCGIISYCVMFAYLQRAFKIKNTRKKYYTDMLISFSIGQMGIIGLGLILVQRVVCFPGIFSYGLKFK